MTTYTAEVIWSRGGQKFVDNRYSRRHLLRFDGGIEVPASSSPHVVPLPYSVPEAVDPEEAFVASLSSCHMLWFLSLAAKEGFVVDHYRDVPEGTMERDGKGKLMISWVTLRPEVHFSGAKQPSLEDFARLHHRAHEECFLANSVKTEVRCEPSFACAGPEEAGERVEVLVKPCTSVDQPGWLALREALWPHCSREEHLAEMASFLGEPQRYGQFVAYTEHGDAAGFAEAALRNDYVNGTRTSPVGYLEGLYVAARFRRRGVARTLLKIVGAWAAAHGCSELASDTAPENTASQAVHRALGFEESERAVFFRMDLARHRESGKG